MITYGYDDYEDDDNNDNDVFDTVDDRFIRLPTQQYKECKPTLKQPEK